MSQAPYDQLYIYEIKGDPRAQIGDMGPAFLGMWLEGDTSFLFFSQPSKAQVNSLVARPGGLRLLDCHQLTYQQWQGGLDIKPLEFDGLCVVPVWEKNDPKWQRRANTVLWLDPGLVFGNGLHPTTRHCLELLLLRMGRGVVDGVLDLGCGTGILGLAAAFKGAKPVLCVDLNPLCVKTARKSAELNGLDVEMAEGPAHEFIGRPAQLVLANLHWQAMAELFANPKPWAGKEDLILSGVTRSHAGPLEDRLSRLGFAVLERRQADQIWFSLWAHKSG